MRVKQTRLTGESVCVSTAEVAMGLTCVAWAIHTFRKVSLRMDGWSMPRYKNSCNGTVSGELGVGDGNEDVDEGQESVPTPHTRYAVTFKLRTTFPLSPICATRRIPSAVRQERIHTG